MNATTSMTTPNDASNRIRLGILQAGRSPEILLGRYPDYNQMFVNLLGEDQFEFRNWPVLDGVFPDSIAEAEAWLITGSRFGAYEDHAWIPPLESLIREIYQASAPMVGICFGHQIIAQALGGKVEKFTGGWSVGRVEYTLDGSVFGSVAQAANEPAALLAFHQDQVTELPPDARNIGSSNFCEHAALIYNDRILTLQPHPEFDEAFIAGLLEARSEFLPKDVMARAEQSLHEPVSREAIAKDLRQFLSRAKG